MTAQLSDSRSQIDEFTRNLQQAVQELERRRQLMETVLENIPAGVISLDASGTILRTNTALLRMFGTAERDTHSLESLLGADARTYGARSDAAGAAHGSGIERDGSGGRRALVAPGRHGKSLWVHDERILDSCWCSTT